MTLKKLTKHLVSNLTECKEGEENFHLGLKFALYNLKHHRFNDVDQKKVDAHIDGLVTKFRIHGKEEFCQAFQCRVERLLDPSTDENNRFGATDANLKILWMLLTLSVSPISTCYIPPVESSEIEEDEQFDWPKYLKEGVPEFQTVFPPSPVISDYSDDEDTAHTLELSRPSISHTNATWDSNQTILPSSYIKGATPALTSESLAQCLVTPYWLGEENASLDSTCSFADNWDSYSSRLDPLQPFHRHPRISEYHVCREVVWLFAGCQNLFCFSYDAQTKVFVPRKEFSLTHISQGLISEFLRLAADSATALGNLREFIKRCLGQEYQCLTYEAFASVSSEFIGQMDTYLSQIQERMTKGEGDSLYTLLELQQSLYPWLQQISIFKEIMDSSLSSWKDAHISQSDTVSPPILPSSLVVSISSGASHNGRTLLGNPSQRRALMLLSCLWDLLTKHEHMDANSAETSLLFQLFMRTAEPYINMADSWLSAQSDFDLYGEFLMLRDTTVDLRSCEFWTKGFIVPDTGASVREDGRAVLTTNRPLAVPHLFKSVLDQIVVAAKSAELISSLGKNKLITEHRPLYELWLESIFELTHTESNEAVFPSDQLVRERSVAERPIDSPRMFVIHTGVLTEEAPTNESGLGLLRRKLAQPIESSTFRHVTRTVAQTLQSHIDGRYHQVSGSLLYVMKSDWSVLEKIFLVEEIFFMKMGDVMRDFYSTIFSLLRSRDWEEDGFLTFHFRDSIRESYPKEEINFSISLKTTERPKRWDTIGALDGMILHYKVEWPVSLILTADALKMYNDIFHFLLQLKRAKSCLDYLKFTDLLSAASEQGGSSTDESVDAHTSPSTSPLSQRLVLFRMKLMNFVNCVHDYIMTGTLHSMESELKQELKKAVSLDQVAASHRRHLLTVHERCLLHSKGALLKEAIMKALTFAVRFQVHWDSGAAHLRPAILDAMEQEFGQCIHFLSSFLTSVTKRGSFPHLEYLAVSLARVAEK